jgi:hypothetical protein
MQNGMGQPLEALQCVLILHFAYEDRVRVTAGDGFDSDIPLESSRSVTRSKYTYCDWCITITGI